ncbi:hypothetical protein KTG15_12995 [Methanobacterium sp. YSL]|nr:hypothetical protein [Methanobacterium sp. YSL]
MTFTAAEMLQYLNYTALGVIGLAMFWGFIQGFYKSTFFLIWTVGILVAGFFLIPVAAGLLMNVDISMASQYVTIEDLTFTTVKDTIINYLVVMQPNLANVLVEGSDTLALVLGIAQLAISLVLFVLLFVLNATVFKFIGWIIWLIIKPKRDSEGKKRKKTFGSRILGAGVGGLRGAFSILLISLPFAALVSLSSGLDLAQNITASQPSYQLMVINDELVLVEVQRPTSEQDEYIDMAKQFLSQYRTSYIGMIAGYVKINEVELDTYVFDSVFSVRVKSENLDTQVKLRSEIEKALNVLSLLVEANDGSTNFGDDFIYKLSPEVAAEVFDLITDLDIIEVVIPIGLEYLINSGDFNEMLTGYEDLLTLEDLKAIDYLADLGILGDVFVNALTLVQAQDVPIDQLNYFQFDGVIVTNIFTDLGKLDILEYGLPVGLNYLIQSEAVQQIYTDLGITSDDITYPTTTQLKADFANIANIYKAVQAMGFDSMDDFDNLTDPATLEAIPDQAIADLLNAVFAFSIVSSNQTVASQYIFNLISESLPAEFATLITQADVTNNFNAAELTNLILLAKVVVSSGVLSLMDDTENPDYATVLSDENIAAIVARISASNLITTKMNDVIAQLLAGLNLGITLVIPPSIDWAAESGQTELTALLKGAREILVSNIISGDLTLLTDEMADNLSGYIADSLVIRYNLNSIFEMALSSQQGLSDYEIALPDSYEEWTETEINSLLKAAIILSNAGSDPSALIGLSEAQVKTIAKSKVIANTFRNVFTTMIDEGGDLEGLLFVPTGLTWYSTDAVPGELEYLLLALQTIVPEGTQITDLNVDLDTLMDADVNVLLRSKVIEMTLVETIKPMIESGDLSAYVSAKLPNGEDYKWYENEDPAYPQGDLKPLLLAIQGLSDLGISFTALDYNAITSALSSEENIQSLNDLLLSSRVLEGSLDKLFTEVLSGSGLNITLDNSNDPTFWKGSGSEDGELIKLLRAVSVVDTNDFDADAFLSLSNAEIRTVAKSRVIAMAFESVITDMAAPGGDLDGQIYIPTNLVWYSTDTTAGELENLLLALKILVPTGEIATADFSFDAIINADLDVLLASKVIEHTAVETIKPMIESGDLADYIAPKLPGNVDYVWYQNTDPQRPEGDLKPLLNAIQDLDAKGISLTTFDYDAFNTALATEADVQAVNDIMVSSRILINSMDKMFTFILNSSAGFDVTLDNSSKPNYWEGTTGVDGELIKLLRAVKVIGSGTVDANSITATLLLDLLETDSEIVRMQISTAILESSIEVPEAAKASPTEIKKTELYALVEALQALGGSVDSVSSLDTSDITAQKLEDLLDAGSYIVNRQISKAILGSSITVPSAALETPEDIYETELRKLIIALNVLGGSVDAVTTLTADDITATMLNDLLDAESLIVNRQISAAILGSSIVVPDAAKETADDIYETELRALVTALTVLGGSVDAVSTLNSDDITASMLSDLLDAQSIIVNRQISSAILGSSITVPATALETPDDIKETELRALVTALTVLGGSVDAVSTLSANDITATMLEDLLDAESIIVNRQISAAILGSSIAVPDAAKETADDIYETELRALVTALTVLGGSVDAVSGLSANDITATKLNDLLNAESIIVNRQISTAIIGSTIDVPTTALETSEDIYETELRKLVIALGVLGGSVDAVSSLSTADITAQKLEDLLDAGSIIVNRQISTTLINSSMDVPSSALETPEDIKETELRALVTALTVLGGSVDAVSSLSTADITAATLEDLLDAESVIVNRQISSTIIGSSMDIPSAALETPTDIYETELRKLVIALNVLGGSVDAISSLSANSITATTLSDLLDAESIIVNRQISAAILGSTIVVPAAAKETPNDIYEAELRKLVLAMNELGMTGSVAEVTNIDSSDLTAAKLDALITINSIIVNRQISTVIIGTGLSIPTDAYTDVAQLDITTTELSALADALVYIPGGIDGITNLTASTITGSMITNLLGAGSVIVNRQISTSIIASGLTSGNTDAIDSTATPRNGEVRAIEMEGLAAALTAMGPTTTVADLTGLSAATVASLDDATIDVMFDPSYTIIYYKLEAEMRQNAVYTMFLDPTDYEGNNTSNRIRRSKLAADLKSGAFPA